MLNDKEKERYSRHILLPEIGIEGQEKLKQAKVLVIGAGGLGCPVLQYLTAAGVGEIGIVDFDIIEESNLQRQVLYSIEDIGKQKALTAQEKLSQQNTYVQLRTHIHRITNKNALEIIQYYDIVVDGTDNFATRYLVNDACVLLGKPLVYGAIYKFEGQVSVFNYINPKGEKGPNYRSLFPNPPSPESSPNCSEIGVMGVLPGIIGTLQAAEVIKIITNIGDPLSGKLLLLDVLSMNMMTINVNRSIEDEMAIPKTMEEYQSLDYDFFCGNKSVSGNLKTVTAKELLDMLNANKSLQLLDVRGLHEQPQIEMLKGLQIPLSEISNKVHLISKEKKIIVYCHSGMRSKRAIETLEKNFGFNNLYNLDGGIMAWIKNKMDE